MRVLTKLLLITLVVLYIVSPVDFCPGPVDDIIVLLMSVAVSKGKNAIVEG